MALLARVLNYVAVLAIIGVLGVAFWHQLARNELPCALCMVQRAGLIGAGLGLLLNVRFGSSESHYGVALVSALVGAVAAGRQVLARVAPGTDALGPTILGLHFDTWAVLVFGVVVLFCAVMLFIEVQFMEGVRDVRVGVIAQSLAWFFVAVALANAVSTLLLCGIEACPDRPTGYVLPWK